MMWIKQKKAYVCFALAVVFLASCSGRSQGAASYEFTNIRRGMLERTVSASGTINPVSTVRVLPRMSGKVERIFVDFNYTVEYRHAQT
jgi:HlyD family secretion protein